MWGALYQIGIVVLSLLYQLAGIFQPKARAFNAGRKNLFQELTHAFHQHDKKIIWVHAASLGEFEQGRPLIEQLKKEYPEVRILLTFFSPSGYNIKKNYEHADYVFYLPWDTKNNASRFLDIVKPDIAIFIKYEFWHNYIDAMHKRNITIVSISTIFRKGQIYFSWYGKYFRESLQKINHFFVQDLNSAQLIESIGIKKFTIAGDTRFDRVKSIQESAEPIPQIRNFKGTKKLFIAGSVWKEDMEVLNPFINKSKDEYCFVIAPHEISERAITKIELDIKLETMRYSKISDLINLSDVRVIIVDNIGLLSKLYRYGDFAFIGGAFGAGLHNIIEASVNGIPVFFGNKKFEKFKEAMDLIRLGAAFPVSNFAEFKQLFDQLQEDKQYDQVKQIALNYVDQNIGATTKIMAYCRTKLSV